MIVCWLIPNRYYHPQPSTNRAISQPLLFLFVAAATEKTQPWECGESTGGQGTTSYRSSAAKVQQMKNENVKSVYEDLWMNEKNMVILMLMDTWISMVILMFMDIWTSIDIWIFMGILMFMDFWRFIDIWIFRVHG